MYQLYLSWNKEHVKLIPHEFNFMYDIKIILNPFKLHIVKGFNTDVS